MSERDDDRAERRGRMLDELSELGMSLARRIHQHAMKAETPQEAERLATTFHHLSRSVRQTLALEARLERDAQRDGREAERRADEVRQARVAERKSRAGAAVSRLIWTEAERSEVGGRLVDLKRLLDAEALDDAFLDTPFEVLVARIRRDIGLAARKTDAGASAMGAEHPAAHSSA